MFSPKGEVIYEKSSSETLSRDVSIKKLKKLAPECNSEENLEGLKIIRFVVSVVAYLLQVAQRQGHMRLTGFLSVPYPVKLILFILSRVTILM